MFLASLLIGLSLFFEVGFVLLVPLAFVISKRMDTPILRVGLPMLAGFREASVAARLRFGPFRQSEG